MSRTAIYVGVLSLGLVASYSVSADDAAVRAMRRELSARDCPPGAVLRELPASASASSKEIKEIGCFDRRTNLRNGPSVAIEDYRIIRQEYKDGLMHGRRVKKDKEGRKLMEGEYQQGTLMNAKFYHHQGGLSALTKEGDVFVRRYFNSSAPNEPLRGVEAFSQIDHNEPERSLERPEYTAYLNASTKRDVRITLIGDTGASSVVLAANTKDPLEGALKYLKMLHSNSEARTEFIKMSKAQKAAPPKGRHETIKLKISDSDNVSKFVFGHRISGEIVGMYVIAEESWGNRTNTLAYYDRHGKLVERRVYEKASWADGWRLNERNSENVGAAGLSDRYWELTDDQTLEDILSGKSAYWREVSNASQTVSHEDMIQKMACDTYDITTQTFIDAAYEQAIQLHAQAVNAPLLSKVTANAALIQLVEKFWENHKKKNPGASGQIRFTELKRQFPDLMNEAADAPIDWVVGTKCSALNDRPRQPTGAIHCATSDNFGPHSRDERPGPAVILEFDEQAQEPLLVFVRRESKEYSYRDSLPRAIEAYERVHVVGAKKGQVSKGVTGQLAEGCQVSGILEGSDIVGSYICGEISKSFRAKASEGLQAGAMAGLVEQARRINLRKKDAPNAPPIDCSALAERVLRVTDPQVALEQDFNAIPPSLEELVRQTEWVPGSALKAH